MDTITAVNTKNGGVTAEYVSECQTWHQNYRAASRAGSGRLACMGGAHQVLAVAAMVQGRARLGKFGAHAVGGGVVVWLGATCAHISLAGWTAGIWRWLL